MTVATCFLVPVRRNESGMLRGQDPEFGIERQRDSTTRENFKRVKVMPAGSFICPEQSDYLMSANVSRGS